MSLNLTTAAVFIALVELTLGIGMLTLWVRERTRYLMFWSSGFIAFSVGSVLISMRDRLPDFFTIMVSNLLTTLSSVLFYVGICVFYGLRRSWAPWAALALEGALLAHYTYGAYDTAARVYIYCSAQALITLITLWTLLTTAPPRERRTPEVVVVTSLFLLAQLARLAGTPFFPVPQDFLAAGSLHTLLAFGMMVVHISYAQAFGNMHAAALNADLEIALADAKNKNRQKVEVLGYIGHDLRAPLAAISGYSALLFAGAHHKQHPMLRTIQRNVKYQLDLIDELLEYAKAELQPLTITPAATDLPLLLQDVADYAAGLCTPQDNRFLFEATGPISRQLGLDGKRLRQVLLNLLSNAAKFTRGGTVALTVGAQPDSAQGCILHFAVSDTGMGIDLGRSADIFSAFQPVGADSQGSGLGLFIAQRIVTAMGSALHVASAPGQGSTFSFVLSAPVIDASPSNWPLPAQPEAGSSIIRPKITLARNTMPDDRSLDELAELALHGRLTDIEAWIERHASGAAQAPFAAVLHGLLENFDFSKIRALALWGRNQAAT